MPSIANLVGGLAVSALVAGAATAGMSGLAQAAPPPASQVLAGSAVPFTSSTQAVGDVAAATRLSVQLWLKPDVAAAQDYATAVSTPGSPLFHHYLSPAAYTARFGASRSAAAAVESWLRSQGFTAVRADAQRTYVRATAAAKTIDAAFRTRLLLYKSSSRVNAGPYALRANDSPVSLPAAVAASVLGVTGLDNSALILPMQREDTSPAGATAKTKGVRCSHYYGQREVSGLPAHFGTTTFPTWVCGYSGSQLRTAYAVGSASTGAGQTIAVVEDGLAPAMFRTLRDYAARNHLPAPSPERYAQLSLGRNTCGDPFFGEEQIDVEASYDMVPGARQLVVGGDSCDNGDFGVQSVLNADTEIIDGALGHPLATIASNSWESGAEGQAPSLTRIEHAILVRAAAEGVGMYFASGDDPGVESPSSDPYAIAVGGTTMGIGKAGHRMFETGWSTGLSFAIKHRWSFEGLIGAAGGGPSLVWDQPGYQKGVVPRALARAPGNRSGALVRSAPDIAADADPDTGMAVGLLLVLKPHTPARYVQIDYGGTSVATPLVAGMVAAAQQGQSVPVGFANPVFYKLAGTSAFYPTLPLTSASPVLYRAVVCPTRLCEGVPPLFTADLQSSEAFGYTQQVTLPGYDNMTGLGTPNGPAFISALRKLEG